jgi:NodT family efflux transporter outer membrane factor (OMF) lipoprotein
MRIPVRRALLFWPAVLLAGCKVGPDYVRPNTPTPLTYKELPAPPEGWTYAKPADGTGGGDWWTIFADPDLTALEARVTVDNQNVKAAEAAYRQAKALIDEARAGLYPTLSASGGVTRGQSNTITSNSANVQAQATWTIDVWGSVRRSIESSTAAAQSSAADLANARLSNQASLATLYFELSYQDELERLLRSTVVAYQHALTITTNQDKFGIAVPTDVITAQTQLDSAQSQLISAGVLRAQYEHAIAALVGVPPVDIDLAPRRLADTLPSIPVSIPSTLLQRRPDIAAAERTMQQQNAQIGVAVAAFYPTISLTALFEYAGSPLSMLFNYAHQAWSLGASAAETVFNGGLRSAEVAAARAAYDQSVADYRQTVLTAFQQVEDQLSNLRILAQQADVQNRADADAARAVTIALNEYQAGTQNYTTVVTEQTILLSDQETLLQIQLQRLTASVTLAQSLGGGWDTAQLPKSP